MADNSFTDLCTHMQGRSVTRGWDALVTMNRTKVNALLEQQYIVRLQRDSFMKKIYGSVELTPDGFAMLDFTGLVLSHPRLSFENATLSNSRARLTMDVESGVVSQRLNVPGLPSRVTESFSVSPQHGFKVYADVDLVGSTGTVEEQGRVLLDLGSAVNFSSNLVAEDLAQQALGRFFAGLYRSLSWEDRVYELGILDFNDDDLLVPREFAIRTQMAPGGNDVLSDSYLDGAVVLFIRTRNNPTNGSLPVDGNGFPYLIPDDRHPESGEAIYSGSLVLASRVVFDWFVEPYLIRHIPGNLRLQGHLPSNDNARKLIAVAGGFLLEDFIHKHLWDGSKISTAVWNDGPFIIPFYNQNAESALSFSSSEDHKLTCSWQGNQPISLWFEDRNLFGIGDKSFGYTGFAKPVLTMKFRAVVDTVEDTVSFPRESYDYSFSGEWLPPEFPSETPRWIFEDTGKLLTAEVNRNMQAFNNMQLPQLNVFHLNHLLFPAQNALLLTQAALPGDLFLAGHIDPKHTSFSLEPSFARVQAGTSLQFQIKQLAMRSTAVRWSARNIDGEQTPDVINHSGLFTAPDLTQIHGLAERYVVTAAYTGDDGVLREASAMVAVVVESLSVTPSIASLEFKGPKPVRFRAANLGPGPLRWTLRDPDFGTLQADGDEATFTLPEVSGGASGGLVVIDVEDVTSLEKTSVCVLWLDKTFALSVEPGFHPGLPAGAEAQLRVVGRNIDPTRLHWSVLAGDGYVDPDIGVFVAPDLIESPYTVVQVTTGAGPLMHRGYALIHLSNFARASHWTELESIKLTSDSNTLNVYGNGLQQVNVTVTVKAKDVGGVPVDVSDEELASIQLMYREDGGKWLPLARVGASGVPEGGGWACNLEANDYLQYPASASSRQTAAGATPAARSMMFYVQSRALGTREIAAALRADDGIVHLSNGVGDPSAPERTITLRCEAPPDYSSSMFTLEPARMEGADYGFDPELENPGNDDDLTTIDYYSLRLDLGGELLPIHRFEFRAAKSMVQWESRQFAEDACSFTGYASSGSRVQHFDPLLYARIPEALRPLKVVDSRYSVKPGELMISLHRCEYWYFDLACEPDYTSGLDLLIHDHYGNRHRVKVQFKDVNNRNSLRAIKY